MGPARTAAGAGPGGPPACGGESGIRTHGSFESPVFKTGSLNHSDISPCEIRIPNAFYMLPHRVTFVNLEISVLYTGKYFLLFMGMTVKDTLPC